MGLLYVGSALKRAGYEVEIIHIYEDEIESAAKKIIKKNPLFVGFSVMTGMQTYHSAQMSKIIKQNSGIPIVWGGIHPTLLPEQCLSEDYIDIIVMREGEETAVELAKALEKKKPIKNILGLGYKGPGGKPCITPMRPFIKDLGTSRIDRDILDFSEYVFKLHETKRTIAYKASRGCCFSCGFCYNKIFNLNKWRPFPEDVVVDDIQYFKDQYDIDGVKFYDDNFYVDRKRAISILERIDVPSHTEIRIDFITDELAKKLKELNSMELMVGIESGSDRMLKLICKGYELDDMKRRVKILAKYGLRVTYSTIIGLPTETNEETWKTLNLMLDIRKMHKNVSYTTGIYMPYPGSSLYDMAVGLGFKPPQRTEDWHVVDRFRDELELPWIDPKYVYRMRNFFLYMQFGGPLEKWLEFRVRHNMTAFPVEIDLMEFMRQQAIEGTAFGKIVRKVAGR
jgi:radical SAM superfamily enzyme YgiQ (UPF0313 family)